MLATDGVSRYLVRAYPQLRYPVSGSMIKIVARYTRASDLAIGNPRNELQHATFRHSIRSSMNHGPTNLARSWGVGSRQPLPHEPTSTLTIPVTSRSAMPDGFLIYPSSPCWKLPDRIPRIVVVETKTAILSRRGTSGPLFRIVRLHSILQVSSDAVLCSSHATVGLRWFNRSRPISTRAIFRATSRAPTSGAGQRQWAGRHIREQVGVRIARKEARCQLLLNVQLGGVGPHPVCRGVSSSGARPALLDSCDT